jgi:4-hydroxyproline epimerase
MVGAILCEPLDSNNTTGVIFFNNSGYLGMCGHATIGLMITLYHLGKVELGVHRIETPVGIVEVDLLSANRAKVDNVPSYRLKKDQRVMVPNIGEVTGDIAWGGNWFFLIKDHGQGLTQDNVLQLTNYTWAVNQALAAQNVVGDDGAAIDHIELFGEPSDPDIADSKNFVLCPGMEYDRSPCGTGTSAKLACLFEDGQLKQGQLWRQQSIIGSIFEGTVKIIDNKVIPSICGDAFVTMDSTVLNEPDDPLVHGF